MSRDRRVTLWFTPHWDDRRVTLRSHIRGGTRMILFINACVRKESRTKRLADALLSEWDELITEIRTVDIEKASRKACARQKSSIMSRLQGEILSPKSSASAMSKHWRKASTESAKWRRSRPSGWISKVPTRNPYCRKRSEGSGKCNFFEHVGSDPITKPMTRKETPR